MSRVHVGYNQGSAHDVSCRQEKLSENQMEFERQTHTLQVNTLDSGQEMKT